ncbi:hypothetical protein [uncultured Veillonella sp.]|uniref:hypothetical protein n=1 Tax=uncultured Veillonella sp. TaxID=159268 RepID=UPI00262481FD|nr:hypothetical protein [uncultured Veillonella sp.]
MRNLLALLTDEEALNLPTNCVITNTYFDTQGTDETVFHDVEYKDNHISVCMSNSSGTLWVELLQLMRPLQIRETPKVDVRVKHITFTKDEIIQFVEDVNDRNRIHREAPYIVPGLLILEYLWNHMLNSNTKAGISIRFLSPMLANDYVFIESQREGNVLVGKLDDMILFKARLYDDHRTN